MSRDKSPVPHTCPMIDEVISAIDSVDWEATYWTKNNLIETMEKIRSANDSLRNWGNEKCDEVAELEDKITDLEKDIKYNDAEIQDLIDEVKSLKFDISNLEEQLSDVTH